MNVDHVEIIYDYVNMDKKIHSKKYELNYSILRFEFANYHGATRFDEVEGVSFIGFKVDEQVPFYLDRQSQLSTQIKKLQRKQKYFKRYLLSLENNERVEFIKKYRVHPSQIENIYTTAIDEQALEEIIEIEEAISYEFNCEVPFDVQREIIQIESLDNDAVEDSFQAVSALLGV